jgi:multiple sugar transport system permease protein
MKKDSMNTDVSLQPKGLFLDGRKKVAYAMVLPAFIILLLLAVGPLFFMIINSFRAWKLSVPAPPRFVGLKNYWILIRDGRFWNAFSNTIILMVIGILVQSLFGLGIALLLRENFRLRSLVVGLLLIPVLIAPVVIGVTWRLLLHNEFGLVNYYLGLLNIQGPLWIQSNRFWGLFSIFIVDTWQWTPFVALVLLAGLESIPQQVYEAADVDGAAPFRVFWKMTLPLLKPMFLLIILLRTIFIFKIFDPVFIITEGGPGVATESLSLFTYYIGMKHFDIGYAMSAGVIQIIFMVLLANVFLKYTTSKKGA